MGNGSIEGRVWCKDVRVKRCWVIRVIRGRCSSHGCCDIGDEGSGSGGGVCD